MILALAAIVQFVTAASVDPIRVDKSGPSLCGDYHAFKIEGSNVDAGTREVSDGNISLNVTIYDANNDGDDEALNWTLNTPGYKIMRVVVMDGKDGGNMYNYTSGTTSDTNLTTPGPGQGSGYTFKDISHVDFCYIASSDTTPALISDFVWNDVNTNGIQDNGETGIADVNVSLYDCNVGSLIENTVTNASGYYNFTVNPGSYFLGFELLAGYAFTLNDQGSDDLDNDVDPATGNTSCITVQSGDINTTFDAGMFEVIPDIDIEKSTNGEDADNKTGPYIRLNYEVVWDFNVTNTGNVNLTDIEVTDDELGLIGTIPLLQPGQSHVLTESGNASLGQYENNATAVGVPPTGPNVTDSDTSHYFGHDSQPIFEVQTANPLLIIGMLGLAGVMVSRRRDK